MTNEHPVSPEGIVAAQERLTPYTLKTPVLTSAILDDMLGCKIYFKCENLQHVGAFKARGATNAVLKLSATLRSKGIATHSSGNHAQAVARAAKLFDIPAYVVMPHNSPEIKKRGVLYYGARLIECEPNLASRESTLADVVGKTGAQEIHPYNDYSIIEGQATAAKELFDEFPGLDIVMAPVGGGGLISGTALSATFFSPKTLVYGAEPEGADDTFRSLAEGTIQPSQANSIAEGLLATVGDKTFPIIRDHVRRVVRVNDNTTIAAMRLLWESLKVIVEPSGAVSFGALMTEKKEWSGKRIGVILSGGNVDLNNALRLMDAISV